MKIIVLASGSNGNSTLVITKHEKIMIDCGLTAKQIELRLEEFGYHLSDITRLLITHEHIDHVRGLRVILNKNPNIDLYISNGTYRGLDFLTKDTCSMSKMTIIKADQELDFEDAKVTVLKAHHDSNECVSFMLEEDGKKLVYITDTGFFEDRYVEKINNPDMLILESNYDVDLLFSSDRPFQLKSRINSDIGHLSNYDSAVIASKVIGPKTRRLVLAHISHDCNFYHQPEIIIKAHKDIYKEIGLDTGNIEFIIGNRDGATGEFEI